MLDSRVRRLLDAYPAIFLVCHRQHVREDERGKTVTEHQASVLDHLDAARATTLSKLAEHMGVSRSTMSITVARLVRGGYITRRRDKDDRRSVGLTLTPVVCARIERRNYHRPNHGRRRSVQSGVPVRVALCDGAHANHR